MKTLLWYVMFSFSKRIGKKKKRLAKKIRTNQEHFEDGNFKDKKLKQQ